MHLKKLFSIFILFLLLSSFIGSAQTKLRQPFPLNLDSLKRALPDSWKDVRDSILDVQKDIRDSLRDQAKDLRDSLRDQAKDLRDSLRDKRNDYIDSVMDGMDKSSHFEVGTGFDSKQLYEGRSSNIKGSAFTPTLTYKHRIGLYASLVTNVWTDTNVLKSTPVPEVDLEFGYSKELLPNWDFDINYSHGFLKWPISTYKTNPRLTPRENTRQSNLYKKQAAYLRGLLNNTFYLSTTYNLFEYITLGMDFDGSISDNVSNKKKADQYSAVWTFYAKKDFLFHIKPAQTISIGPEFDVNVGTGNVATARSNTLKFKQGDTTIITTQEHIFWGLLDVEGGVNIAYRIKNLELSVSSKIAIPFNVTAAQEDNKYHGPSDFSGVMNKYFYVSASVKYLFHAYKKQKLRGYPNR